MEEEKQQFWNTDTILLGLCVLLGTLLRFGNPMDLAFINDELSTWNRINYDSVMGVIDNVKATDSHPAGLYVFLYYWTGLFGSSEFSFKIPFLLMSIATMFLVYRIAASWFSKTVGLFVLAYFATLQFPIWWSSIARQYQSGLFCTLLMAYCWTELLIEKKDKNIYWMGFILMGAAAMYNHYFSFIFAGLIGLSGFVFLRKEIIWKYLISGVLMFLLFAPHFQVTLYHLLNAKGHEWYNLPTPSFLIDHIHYIFHYSILSWGLMLLLIIGSLVGYGKITLKENWKTRWTAVFLFLTPFLFGYFYSIYKAPILRESHLLFSFPYLLLFLLSFFPKELPKQGKVGIVFAILILNTYTLITTRSHFETANSHPYEPFIVETKAFLEEHPKEEVTILLGENPVYLQYYKDFHAANFEHLSSFKPMLPFMEFKALLENSVTSYLIIGSLPEAQVQMAMDYYPYLYKKSYGINYEYYILSKVQQPQTTPLVIDYQAVADFDYGTMPNGWEFDRSQIVQNSKNGNFYYNMNQEWGPTYTKALTKISPRNNQFLDIALTLRVVDSIPIQPEGVLVLEIRNEQDSVVLWKGLEINGQTTISKDWQRVYLSLRFAHEPFYDDVKKLTMKTFFWNRKKQKIHLDRYSITSCQGNLILYGDTNNFRKGM